MRILFFGDIVGKSGRNEVKAVVKELKAQYQCDFVICNGENSAHGKGITTKIYYDLVNHGIDFITLGNHAFSKSEIKLDFNKLDKMIRPGNIINASVGNWYKIVNINNKKVAIVNLLGAAFMDVCEKSPFEMMEALLDKQEADIYIVDFHGETTGEKLAFAYYFGDRISMMVGTHTHVQTADNRIIKNCAYISDVGMCGPYISILGRDVDEVVTRFISDEKPHYKVAENPACISAVVVEIDEETSKALQIDRLLILP